VEEARSVDRPVSIVVFDVDHFKRLNDTYGYASGDEVIRKFAGMLKRIAPEGSILGRIGRSGGPIRRFTSPKRSGRDKVCVADAA
jgi:diguanylate cyclase (GGDEF)-like protein